MRLILIRHGQTKSNNLKIVQGWENNKLSILNNEGLKQAKKVANRLKNKEVDIIFSSDLKRAADTAKEIGNFHNCKIILDKRLREQNRGKYQGGPSEKFWNDFKISGKDIFKWIPEGGESMDKVKNRVLNFLNEIKNKHKDKTVLLVSHGGVLNILSKYFHDDIEFDKKFNNDIKMIHEYKNTSISEYFFDGKKWNIIKINSVKHLL